MHEHFSWFAPVLLSKLPNVFLIILIYLRRMWKPRLHSTSGWQLVQQKNTQFQSPSGLSSVDAKNMSRRELPVIVGTNGWNERNSINLAKQAICSVSSEICLFDKKVYQISKKAKNSARLKIQECWYMMWISRVLSVGQNYMHGCMGALFTQPIRNDQSDWPIDSEFWFIAGANFGLGIQN